jgi:hypothetical protein
MKQHKQHKKHNIGGSHPRAKFSDKIVKRIKELRKSGVTPSELARFYSTTPNHITKLCTQYYKHLDSDVA